MENNMKIYRGVDKEKYNEYKKKGIPIGENFTNRLSGARNKGSCVIKLEKTNKFIQDKTQNKTFKRLNISERYYKNKKIIKRFKSKCF